MPEPTLDFGVKLLGGVADEEQGSRIDVGVAHDGLVVVAGRRVPWPRARALAAMIAAAADLAQDKERRSLDAGAASG